MAAIWSNVLRKSGCYSEGAVISEAVIVRVDCTQPAFCSTYSWCVTRLVVLGGFKLEIFGK